MEKKHKEEDDCGCDGESMSQLEKSIERSKKKVEEAKKSISMNALEFGLKMKKTELDKIPIGVGKSIFTWRYQRK